MEHHFQLYAHWFPFSSITHFGNVQISYKNKYFEPWNLNWHFRCYIFWRIIFCSWFLKVQVIKKLVQNFITFHNCVFRYYFLIHYLSLDRHLMLELYHTSFLIYVKIKYLAGDIVDFNSVQIEALMNVCHWRLSERSFVMNSLLENIFTFLYS